MVKKNIVVVCSAGMSTSLLVKNMLKAVERRGLDYTINAFSGTDVQKYFEKNNIDLLLLGPQVRYMKKQFAPQFVPNGIPVEVINMKDYGLMDGESVIYWAEELMNDK